MDSKKLKPVDETDAEIQLNALKKRAKYRVRMLKYDTKRPYFLERKCFFFWFRMPFSYHSRQEAIAAAKKFSIVQRIIDSEIVDWIE